MQHGSKVLSVATHPKVRAVSREAKGRGGKRNWGRARSDSREAEGRGGKRNGGRACAVSREAEGRGGKGLSEFSSGVSSGPLQQWGGFGMDLPLH